MVRKTLFSFILFRIVCFSCKQVSSSRITISFDKLSVNAKENPITIERKPLDFSWILHMFTIILTANFWGIYRKEWYC